MFYYIFCAVINGEKATFNTPIFAQKRERTLDMLIKDLCSEQLGDSSRAVSVYLTEFRFKEGLK